MFSDSLDNMFQETYRFYMHISYRSDLNFWLKVCGAFILNIHFLFSTVGKVTDFLAAL